MKQDRITPGDLGSHCAFLLYSAGLSRVHVVQQMAGWECNDETGDIIAHQQYSYDGEAFISLALKTLTWITPRPQAVATKHEWDGDKCRYEF